MDCVLVSRLIGFLYSADLINSYSDDKSHLGVPKIAEIAEIASLYATHLTKHVNRDAFKWINARHRKPRKVDQNQIDHWRATFAARFRTVSIETLKNAMNSLLSIPGTPQAWRSMLATA